MPKLSFKRRLQVCIDKCKNSPCVEGRFIPSLLMQFARESGRLATLVPAVLVLFSLMSGAEAKLSRLDQLFSFGDSNNDTGNSAALTFDSSGSTTSFPPPPNFNGRASNGLLAHEYLWSLFNPSSPGPSPSFLGGTNYAISGATTGHVNFNTLSPIVPTILKPAFLDLGTSAQLNSFLLDHPSFNPSTSLFYISTFPNDVMYWLATSQASGGNGLDSGTVTGLPATTIGSDQTAITLLVDNGVSNIELLITALASQGAKHFLVPSMIDLGLTPLFRNNPDPGLAPMISQLSLSYNSSLANKLHELQIVLPGIDIIPFRTDALLSEVVMHPGAYGFENVTDSCFNVMTGDICSNPDRWLFWDYFHPTTAAQGSIGYAMYNQMYVAPAPAPFAAVCIGFRFSQLLRKRIKSREAIRSMTSPHL